MNKFLKLELVTILFISIVCISGCIEGLKKPSPIIKDIGCEQKIQGFNTVTESNVLVTNDGASGEVIVEARFISKTGATYYDTKIIYMNSGETKYVTFVFDTDWDEEGVCTASAKAK